MSDYPDTPITREEQYLAAGLDGGDLPDPITREEQYLYEIATKMQGGGSSVTVEPLTVTANGTQTAPSGKAYSPVTTNVPNSYGASDEGKVVSNGALVAQTAHAPVTANGTIDTTLNNSVPVNVPNPNYVETIKTVRVKEIPKETIARIHEGYITNAITAYIDTKSSSTGHAYWTEDEDELGTFSSATTSSGGGADHVWYASFLGEEDDFALYECKQTTNGTTWSDQSAQRIDIVIIHHPMPDSE